jgi:hypothetical protein
LTRKNRPPIVQPVKSNIFSKIYQTLLESFFAVKTGNEAITFGTVAFAFTPNQ